MIRNFSGGTGRHHHDWGRSVRAAPGCSHIRARMGRVPGGDRPPLQPGGHAGRGHHLPLRQGPAALARHPAGRHAAAALLHQLHPAAGGLHQRSVRGAGSRQEALGQRPGHRRHGVAPLPGRALAGCPACRLVRRAAACRLPHITVTPTFSICRFTATCRANTTSVRPSATSWRCSTSAARKCRPSAPHPPPAQGCAGPFPSSNQP